MREGRNENLVNALEISQKTKKKALKCTVLLAIFAIILLAATTFATGGIDIYLLLIVSILFIAVFISCYELFAKAYKNEEIERISTLVVERCLSTEVSTEVIPIKQFEHESFILGLQDRAKFYAVISKYDDRRVNVYVQFLDEEEGRFLEYVDKADFLEYYSIREEEQAEEE